MKLFAVCLCACAFIAFIIAGCTTVPPTTPVTPTQTIQVFTPPPTTAPTIDPALVGTWYLKAVTGPGGANPVQTIGIQISAIFNSQGNLAGFGGCNNYNAPYTLTGAILPNGKGIVIGPITNTLKFCADTSDREGTYLQTLQDATSYSVNVDQLSITNRDGSILLFGKTPYGVTAVPIGV